MRDWSRIDSYLTSLEGDVYPQPTGNDEHPAFAKQVIDSWMSKLTGCNTVLDVGCGEGFCEDFFKEWGAKYEGVCLGDDYLVARERGRNVKKMDFSFLEYEENSFDLVFSRHSLEHSPMPLLTLFEWARVTKQWLGLVLPHPDFYTYKGLNHYAVMEKEQAVWLLDRAGFKVLWDEVGYISVVANKTLDNPSGATVHEIRLFCEKKR
jgi:SAM-dependent methyltransferase